MSETMIRIAGIVEESIVDGPGVRTVVFTQGCPHHCPGCHNPQTHSFTDGKLMPVDALITEITKNKLVRGVTLSGGEPFCQSKELIPFVRGLKSFGYDVMGFSGYLYDTLCSNHSMYKLLCELSYLIDGPYKKEEHIYGLHLRGSKNQRIIDVQRSISDGKVVLADI